MTSPADVSRGTLAHIVSGDVIGFSVIRGRPLTLRIASICSSGSESEDRLADAGRMQRHATAELDDRFASFRGTAPDRRNTASSPIENAEIRRLARLLHQTAHIRMALRDEVRGSR
jgi:hypothetical protein